MLQPKENNSKVKIKSVEDTDVNLFNVQATHEDLIPKSKRNPTLQAKAFQEQIVPTEVPFQMNEIDLEQMHLDNIEQPPRRDARPIPVRDPNEDKFYFTDRRETHPVTGAQINPNRDLMSGFYSTSLTREIVKQSEANNLDPNEAIAIALQETNLGKKDSNIGHVKHYMMPGRDKDFDNKNVSQMIKAIRTSKEWGPKYFKETHNMTDEQYNAYDKETWRLQSYNGLGIVDEDTEAEYLDKTNRTGQYRYGIDVSQTPIDMKENPVYAKTIYSLREQISKDRDFQRIINENKTPEQKLVSFMKKQK
jgi:hypothetical protein